MTRVRASLCLATLLALAFVQPPAAQSRGTLAIIAPQSTQTLRDWDATTQSMIRSGELRVRRVDDDTLVAGRTHERSDQYYRGVRVFGGDIARELDAQGVVVSLFGTLYDGIDVSPDPELDADAVRPIVNALAGLEQPPSRQPELVVLPLRGDTGGVQYRLAWRVRAVTSTADIIQYFLDASTGAVLHQYSDRQTQSAVGRGTGVLGDAKKVSASGRPGAYVTRDLLRPARIDTNDFKGDATRVLAYLNGVIIPQQSDLASDTDNVWTDGAVVDAHVYAGYTYDYYFKRFGRHGLNDRNNPVEILGNPARREDIATNFSRFPDFYVNAFYAGNGIVLFGVGLPSGSTLFGQSFDFFSAAIDIVGHELTHGVTEFTSGLIYQNESGALNEAFSDIMGVSVEFFFQPPGDGPLQADYEQGEDAIRPGGSRSLDNPALHGHPDHYSKRFLGSADNGGVHANSTIASHAFYLAIEGGTNRTSGLAVQGVGAANREQIEKVFYRAFTQLLPSNATFSVARAATIQAARDLYGAGSAPERAVTQAWAAVGVS